MSEMIWCHVKVKTPRTWNTQDDKGHLVPPWFMEDLNNALCNGDGIDVWEEADGFVIWSVNGEGNYGLADSDVEDVIAQLLAMRVPHVAHDDPKYEYSGSNVYYDGNETHDVLMRVADGEGGITMTESHWVDMQNLDNDAIARRVRHLFTVPTIEDMPIDHLPTECPTREEVPA
jgi:hypothetical protein